MYSDIDNLQCLYDENANGKMALILMALKKINVRLKRRVLLCNVLNELCIQGDGVNYRIFSIAAFTYKNKTNNNKCPAPLDPPT